MAEKKDPIRSLIDTGRHVGKLTSSEISDAMEENGNVLDVEAMEKLYEELESNGIEIVDERAQHLDRERVEVGRRPHGDAEAGRLEHGDGGVDGRQRAARDGDRMSMRAGTQ